MGIKILDSYEQLFEIFPRSSFYEFGLKNIISVDIDKAKESWKNLINNVNKKDNDLYIRNSGRNGTGNKYLLNLYQDIFDIQINFDQTNNDKPSRIIQNLTGYKKNKNIFNYQVSHVFGNTKNVYCFTAPWNIVFIPKVIDPFTGHEAKGIYVDDFKNKFLAIITNKYRNLIIEYNKIIRSKYSRINKWVDKNIPEELKISILKDFQEIPNCG